MKFLFVLSVVFLASAQANFFSDLGNAFSTVFHTIGTSIQHELDTTGVQLLKAGISAGKDLVSQGLQAAALNTANALKSQTDGSTATKRDLSVLKQVESSIHNVVDNLGGVFTKNLNQLSAGLKGVMEKVGNMHITPQEVITEVDQLVATHNLNADGILKMLESKVKDVITSLALKHKRNAFTDFFSGVGSSLASAFKPAVDGVKSLASTAGTLVKTGAAGLLSAAKESISQLGTKLQPHIQNLSTQLGTIVQHGSNALSAMKEAGTDILQQTLQNMKDPLSNMAGTLTDAGKTVVNHVSGTLLGTNTEGTDTSS